MIFDDAVGSTWAEEVDYGVGTALSRGLPFDWFDPAGRLFLLSISLCTFRLSTSRVIWMYSMSTENGLEARETSALNLDANRCWPSGDRSHVTVSSKSTSYSTFLLAVFHAEMN